MSIIHTFPTWQNMNEFEPWRKALNFFITRAPFLHKHSTENIKNDNAVYEPLPSPATTAYPTAIPTPAAGISIAP